MPRGTSARRSERHASRGTSHGRARKSGCLPGTAICRRMPHSLPRPGAPVEPRPFIGRAFEPSHPGWEARSLKAGGSLTMAPARELMRLREGRRRVVIEGVQPEIDGGRFPVKRVVGERVTVEADVFADGHDAVAADLRFRRDDEVAWRDVRMAFVENDRWRAAFPVSELGWYWYTLRAWVDRFGTWRGDLEKKAGAGQEVTVELPAG